MAFSLSSFSSTLSDESNKNGKNKFLGTYNMLGLARRVGAKILLARLVSLWRSKYTPESYTGSVNTTGIRILMKEENCRDIMF